jgi:hypothetical protein
MSEQKDPNSLDNIFNTLGIGEQSAQAPVAGVQQNSDQGSAAQAESSAPTVSAPWWVPATGAAMGAGATWKGSQLLSPDPNLFSASSQAEPSVAQASNTYTTPKGIEVEVTPGGMHPGAVGNAQFNTDEKLANQLHSNKAPGFKTTGTSRLLTPTDMKGVAPVEAPAAAPAANSAERLAQEAKIWGYLKGLGKMGLNAIGAGLTAKDLWEAYNAKDASKGLGAGAGALSLVAPLPLKAPLAGMAMSMQNPENAASTLSEYPGMSELIHSNASK